MGGAFPKRGYNGITIFTYSDEVACMEGCSEETFSSGGDPVAKNLAAVKDRLSTAYENFYVKYLPGRRNLPRLVAVSKTKPVDLILRAYEEGQRHFGENYVQALVEKAQNPRLSCLDDICWHFIGHLQRNKCNHLTSCPHLWMVETVDSERLATCLDLSHGRRSNNSKLNILVQVNTSREEAKSGCLPGEVLALVRHINENCKKLKFCGFMTIGKIGHDYATGPNPDFETLVSVQRTVSEELQLDPSYVELSMGMSADFEEAIQAGSTSVRVGTVIFGTREPKVA